MNPSPEFLGIQLENSILCKHRKIAGKVETIFCEAAPIRLNEITRLKRLGPEPIAFDRCPECRQFLCNCLWKKHVHVRPNEKFYSGNSNAANISRAKSRSKVNATPFKIRKRNVNYGNTYSTQMAWVKKPIRKMNSSGDEFTSARRSHHTLKTNTENKAHKNGSKNASQTLSCILEPTGKIDANDYIQLREEYFEERKQTAAEKCNQNRNTVKIVKKSKMCASPKASKLNRTPETLQATKYSKDKSTPKQNMSKQLNMMIGIEPVQIPPQSPVAITTMDKVRQQPKITNHRHRVSEVPHARSIFDNQARCSCQTSSAVSSARSSPLKKATETSNYPSRFITLKSDSTECRCKASEFLLKYKEAEAHRPARSIESLENLKHQVKKHSPLTQSTKVANAQIHSAFYNDPRTFEQAMHQRRIDHNSVNGNKTKSTRNSAYDRGENIIMKHIAVQTEESSFSISKLIKAQTASKCDLVAADSDADQTKDDNTAQFKATPVELSLQRTQQDYGEDVVKELVFELTDDVAKCNTRVKKLAAFFDSRGKTNSGINNRNISLSLPNVRHFNREVDSQLENTKPFCSAADLSKNIENQTQKRPDNEVIIQEPAAENNAPTTVINDNTPKVDIFSPNDEDLNQNDDSYSSSSLSKSSSQISITTVVLNPFKKHQGIIKSKDFNVFDSYELGVP